MSVYLLPLTSSETKANMLSFSDFVGWKFLWTASQAAVVLIAEVTAKKPLSTSFQVSLFYYSSFSQNKRRNILSREVSFLLFPYHNNLTLFLK